MCVRLPKSVSDVGLTCLEYGKCRRRPLYAYTVLLTSSLTLRDVGIGREDDYSFGEPCPVFYVKGISLYYNALVGR